MILGRERGLGSGQKVLFRTGGSFSGLKRLSRKFCKGREGKRLNLGSVIIPWPSSLQGSLHSLVAGALLGALAPWPCCACSCASFSFSCKSVFLGTYREEAWQGVWKEVP